MTYWQTSRRQISLAHPLVMGILNVTPDSFSDGGQYLSPDAGDRRAEELINEGADILDIGGESTRPGSSPVSLDEEKRRVLPVIESIAGRFDVPISIDTTRSAIAQAAISAGAEIINDISGLRFDDKMARVAAGCRSGLVLMHSRGDLDMLHSQPPVENIVSEVLKGLNASAAAAAAAGVGIGQIVVDIGLGFGKTFDQNLELLAKLDNIVDELKEYPVLVGASRKSFIGKVLNEELPRERLGGSIAAAVLAVIHGARIVRVHDVKETVSALRFTDCVMGSD